MPDKMPSLPPLSFEFKKRFPATFHCMDKAQFLTWMDIYGHDYKRGFFNILEIRHIRARYAQYYRNFLNYWRD